MVPAGFCAAYLIFIKKNLANLLSVPANLCVAVLLPLQIILSMLRDVHSLAPFSLLADFANCIGARHSSAVGTAVGLCILAICGADVVSQCELLWTAGFAVILLDDAIVLTARQSHVSAFQGGIYILPYLFGVAVYAFEG